MRRSLRSRAWLRRGVRNTDAKPPARNCVGLGICSAVDVLMRTLWPHRFWLCCSRIGSLVQLLLTGSLLALAAGCHARSVRVPSNVPVLVGPVHTLGGYSLRKPKQGKVGFEGKATRSIFGAGSRTVEGDYVVTRTTSISVRTNDISRSVFRATQGVIAPVAFVKRIRVSSWGTFPLFIVYGTNDMKVDGVVVRKDTLTAKARGGNR